jgi:predicted O-methyltransferase YrrM
MKDVRHETASLLQRWSAHLEQTGTAALTPKDEKRVRHFVSEEAFRQARARCRVRELPLAAIFPGIERLAIPLGAINEETGHANHAEMLYVIAAAQYRHARRIFEFGTFLGRTTYHLAATHADAHVWTIDLPPEENPWPFADHVGAYFARTPEAARITRVCVDSGRFDTSPFAGSADFVWVDADHSYAGVKNDTEKAFELLAPGGMIMWHDFGHESPGLVDFFVDFTARQPLFQVRRTSVLLHIDGVDPLAFEPHPVPFTKALFKK